MKKFLSILLSLLLLTILGLPIYIYTDSLSKLNSFPEKPYPIDMNDDQLVNQWANHEKKATIKNYDSITPFWLYKWLGMAILHDYFHIKSFDAYTNVSSMAGQIAITHMRKSTSLKHRLKMSDWHILHISLSIYIQRNWSAKEILAKYNEIDS